MSTHIQSHVEAQQVRAFARINITTPTLSIEALGVSMALFLEGTPSEVWDALDQIIDAARALKVRVLPPVVHVDPESACNPKLTVGPGERGLVRRCTTHGLALYGGSRLRCDAYLAAAEAQGLDDLAARQNS